MALRLWKLYIRYAAVKAFVKYYAVLYTDASTRLGVIWPPGAERHVNIPMIR